MAKRHCKDYSGLKTVKYHASYTSLLDNQRLLPCDTIQVILVKPIKGMIDILDQSRSSSFDFTF